MVGVDKLLETTAYGVGSVIGIGIVARIFPAASMSLKGVKAGARFGKAVISFRKSGWLSPSFYINSASAGLSTASLILQGSSYVIPPLSGQLYAGSQFCSMAADSIDDTLGWHTTLY